MRKSTLLLAAVLAGCAAQGPVPEDRFYRLAGAAAVEPLAHAVVQGSVAVRRLRADGTRGERPIVYGEAAQPLELRQYHYHYWIDVPPRLLQDHLVDYLRRSNVATGVFAEEAGVSADYVVAGKIQRFERIIGGAQPRAIVALELALYRSGTMSPVFVGDYSAEATATDATMHASVEGFDRALGQVVADFVRDMRTRLVDAASADGHGARP